MNTKSIAVPFAVAIAVAPAAARADGSIMLASTAPPDSAVTSAPAPFESPPPVRYEQPDQLLLPGEVTHGGYGGPSLKLTTLRSEAALLVGGQGGWIINHGLILGAAGYGLATTHDAPAALSPIGERSTLQFGYGGPRVVYIARPHDVVHVTFALLVGAGGYTILTRNDAWDDSRTHDGRAFFVLEPEAEIETNVLRFLRMGVGISYRYVGTRAVSGLASSDLSGPAASFVVKAGAF